MLIVESMRRKDGPIMPQSRRSQPGRMAICRECRARKRIVQSRGVERSARCLAISTDAPTLLLVVRLQRRRSRKWLYQFRGVGGRLKIASGIDGIACAYRKQLRRLGGIVTCHIRRRRCRYVATRHSCQGSIRECAFRRDVDSVVHRQRPAHCRPICPCTFRNLRQSQGRLDIGDAGTGNVCLNVGDILHRRWSRRWVMNDLHRSAGLRSRLRTLSGFGMISCKHCRFCCVLYQMGSPPQRMPCPKGRWILAWRRDDDRGIRTRCGCSISIRQTDTQADA